LCEFGPLSVRERINQSKNSRRTNLYECLSNRPRHLGIIDKLDQVANRWFRQWADFAKREHNVTANFPMCVTERLSQCGNCRCSGAAATTERFSRPGSRQPMLRREIVD
jgi:hypothetical protein